MTDVTIRGETSGDSDAIRAVNAAAFGQALEGQLVDTIRGAGQALVSLVAEDDSGIGGHILFTPVTIETPGTASTAAGPWAGLAPMAVAPLLQRQGIGSALVTAGLEQCRSLGIEAVVVLGHPEFYPRFGFRPASAFGLRCEFPVPDEMFMAIELGPQALLDSGGLVRYLPVFRGGA